MKLRAGLLLCCLLLSACASPRAWMYQASPPVERTPLSSQILIVTPMVDARSPKNEDRILFYMIPLMPFGWVDANVPEGGSGHLTSGGWSFRPTEDIAQALAMEVNNRRIFKEAYFTHRESEGDLVLRSTLISTRYEGKVMSYGLSVYGPLLWFLGLPAGTFKNDVALKVSLEDRSSKKTLWENSYKAEHDEGVFWLYGMPSDFWYDTMLKDLMPTIMSDLENALKNGATR